MVVVWLDARFLPSCGHPWPNKTIAIQLTLCPKRRLYVLSVGLRVAGCLFLWIISWFTSLPNLQTKSPILLKLIEGERYALELWRLAQKNCLLVHGQELTNNVDVSRGNTQCNVCELINLTYITLILDIRQQPCCSQWPNQTKPKSRNWLKLNYLPATQNIVFSKPSTMIYAFKKIMALAA